MAAIDADDLKAHIIEMQKRAAALRRSAERDTHYAEQIEAEIKALKNGVAYGLK